MFVKNRFCLYFFRKLVEVAWLVIPCIRLLQRAHLPSYIKGGETEIDYPLCTYMMCFSHRNTQLLKLLTVNPGGLTQIPLNPSDFFTILLHPCSYFALTLHYLAWVRSNELGLWVITKPSKSITC